MPFPAQACLGAKVLLSLLLFAFLIKKKMSFSQSLTNLEIGGEKDSLSHSGLDNIYLSKGKKCSVLQ